MENYDSSSVGSGEWIFAIIGACIIPILILSVILIIAHWKIYTKAGKPGWACVIPFYNIIVLLEIIGKPIWWIFLIIFPCTAPIFGIWATNLLSKSFGKDEGYTVGLLLLPFIFYPILGFGSAVYVGPAAAEAKRYSPDNFQDPFNHPNPPPQV